MLIPNTRFWRNRNSSRLRDQLLRERYLRKDWAGDVMEKPDEMFWRVGAAVAKAEHEHGATRKGIAVRTEQFSMFMDSGQFMPNSPTLMNAGRNALLSACFVLPVPDSIDGIFRSVWDTALIQKAGGGTGFAFDQLRPTGDLVASSGGKTSGPISFLRVFAEATSAIQQGAFRRGANMGMMSVEHPDILRFIAAKEEPGLLGNFNLSVKVPDPFMQALAECPDQPHLVTNPRDKAKYLIPRNIDVRTYTLENLVPADALSGASFLTVAEIWAMIVQRAWKSGEPGIAFIDRVNADNPTPCLGRIEATNPCGEQPLLEYESCNLGSLNLALFVQPGASDLDWGAFRQAIRLAVRFLDDVMDANCYPTETIRSRTLGNRKIGLGVMGFADALILLGIRYDSQGAVDFARKVARYLTEHAHEASRNLARKRGSFPNWQGSVWEKRHRPMRNAACTTIAPTGSISIIAGCSSGIEPVFSFGTRRRALDGKEFISIHPLLEELGQQEGWMNESIRESLLQGTPPKSIPGIPQPLAEVMVTAHEVGPEWHIRIQAAFQENIDNAVSKTVNLSATATVEDVDRIFRMAYDLGCKGITVYRDGSRQGQTLSAAGKKPSAATSAPGSLTPRPRVMPGQTSKHRAGCAPVYVTVNKDEHGLPKEVFAALGTGGGCPSQSEATCRAVSAALRSGVDPRILIEQLKGIRCASTSVARKSNPNIDVLSCPDAIARAIEEAIGETPAEGPQTAPSGRPCPHCRRPMRKDAGCFRCDYCQFDSCG
jgi:ribonucleoside-diphosphate reductase alpha chain